MNNLFSGFIKFVPIYYFGFIDNIRKQVKGTINRRDIFGYVSFFMPFAW